MQPLAITLHDITPRVTDFEELAHAVAAYRIVDVYLNSSLDPLTPPTTRRPSDNNPRSLKVVPGFHPISDWPSLVAGLPDLMQGATVGQEIESAEKKSLVTLAKNTIRSCDGAALSGIRANLNLSAMYLLCLCDEASTRVSNYPGGYP